MVLCFREGKKTNKQKTVLEKKGGGWIIAEAMTLSGRWGMECQLDARGILSQNQKFDLRNADTVGRWMKVKVAQLCLTLRLYGL